MTPSPETMSSTALFERLREERKASSPDLNLIEAMSAEYNKRAAQVVPVRSKDFLDDLHEGPWKLIAFWAVLGLLLLVGALPPAIASLLGG